MTTHALPERFRRMTVSMGMSNKPDAHRVNAMIIAAARRQAVTTAEGQAIISAGLGAQLDALIVAIAGNASMPIAAEFEDDDAA